MLSESLWLIEEVQKTYFYEYLSMVSYVCITVSLVDFGKSQLRKMSDLI